MILMKVAHRKLTPKDRIVFFAHWSNSARCFFSSAAFTRSLRGFPPHWSRLFANFYVLIMRRRIDMPHLMALHRFKKIRLIHIHKQGDYSILSQVKGTAPCPHFISTSLRSEILHYVWRHRGTSLRAGTFCREALRYGLEIHHPV